MRVAIVGAGISGNVCAWLLHADHEIVLFEAESHAGGHTRTVDIQLDGRSYSVDTGFMVFNDRTYPNFIRLLERLQVPTQPSDMSFSVRCERTGLEYQGSSLNGLFAQRRNLANPRFYGMLRDILRFNRRSTGFLQEQNDRLTLGEYLAREQYGDEFVQHYLVPMTAAIWSAPPRRVLEMPARFLITFCENHGLLQLRGRPPWRTIPSGARRYVQAMARSWNVQLRLQSPIRSVRRLDDGVELTAAQGDHVIADCVIFACHADQVLNILQDASDVEREVLERFPYQANRAILHVDTSFLPRSRALGRVGTTTFRLRRMSPWRSRTMSTACSRSAPATHLFDAQLPGPHRCELYPADARFRASGFRARDSASPAIAGTHQWCAANLLLWCLLGIWFSRGWSKERADCVPALRQDD